jgi:hypothetical protein
MFHVQKLDGINSYATAANAIAAVEKRFGSQFEGERRFNVLLVRNDTGRFVPILHSVSPGHHGTIAHAGFMVVN